MRNGYRYVVADIEADNLLREVTKIHCLSYYDIKTKELNSLTDYEDIKNFVTQENLVLIMHNGILYDKAVLEKLLNIKIKCQLVDTLSLSWYLFVDRKKHGLEHFGIEYGILKPEIKDWNNLDISVYKNRCETDVMINLKLWEDCYSFLLELYDNNFTAINNLFKYFEFKLNCIAIQERVGIRFDEKKCNETLELLYKEKESKVNALSEAMPANKIYAIKEYPAKPYKKDGTLSSTGEKWFNFLDAHGLPEDHTEPVKYVKELEAGNPGSVQQVKDWLYSLGWKPDHIKYVRDKVTNETKEIEQIKHKDPDKSDEVCESIQELFKVEPKLELLSGLSLINHRIGLLEGFKRDSINGRLYPSIAGFTNTFRMRHKVIQNLVKPSLKWGTEIRACLIADEGCVLLGSDLKNLESTSRNNFIYKLDPTYVNTLINDKEFDSHTEIAVLAGFMTVEEENFFKWYKNKEKSTVVVLDKYKNLNPTEQHELYTRLNKVRALGKMCNFASLYNVMKNTLARNANITVKEAEKLLEVYWQRNWSVKKFSESIYIKTVRGKMWSFNPLSKFFYSQRNERDIFSTINQGAGVFCFDIFLSYIIKQNILPCLQYHDELVANIKKEDQEKTTESLLLAIKQTNDFLKMNVQLDCSFDYNVSYDLIH